MGGQPRLNNLTSQVLISPLRSNTLQQPQSTSYFQSSGNGFHNNLANVMTTTNNNNNNNNNVFKHTGNQQGTSNSSHQVRQSINNVQKVHSFKASSMDTKTQQIEALMQENAKLVQIVYEKNEQLKQGGGSSQEQVEEVKEQLKQEQEQYVAFKKKVMLVIDENENLQNIYDQISKSYQQLEQQMNESNQLKTELAQDNQQKQDEIHHLQHRLHQCTEGSTDEVILQLREDIGIQQGLITDYEQKINVLLEENDKMGQVIKDFNDNGKNQNQDKEEDKVEQIKRELQELLARY